MAPTRRSVIKKGIVSCGLIAGGSNLVSATQDSARKKDPGRERANQRTRSRLENEGWTKRNENIYYKEIERVSVEEAEAASEVPGLKIVRNNGAGNGGGRIQANLNKLPYIDDQTEQRMEQISQNLEVNPKIRSRETGETAPGEGTNKLAAVGDQSKAMGWPDWYQAVDIDLDSSYIYETISEVTHAAKDSDTWQPISVHKGISYNFGDGRMESAGLADAGWGGWKGEVYLSRYINPTGSGERSVKITFEGNIDGYVICGGSGSASATIEARFTNIDSNATNSETIKSWSYSRVGSGGPELGTDYSQDIYTELDSNDMYRVDVKLSTEVNVQGGALVSSDFGGGDGDDYEFVDIDEITVIAA